MRQLTLISLTVCAVSCSAQTTLTDEQQFQEMVMRRQDILKRGDSLLDRFPEDRQAVAAMEKLDVELAKTTIQLQQFVRRYPTSKYADDAAFLLAVTTGLDSRGGGVTAMTAFLQRFPQASLEEWTKTHLTDVAARELGALQSARLRLITELGAMKRYRECIEASKQFIEAFDRRQLSSRTAERQLGLGYFLLRESYAMLGDRERTMEVEKEMLATLPHGQDVLNQITGKRIP